MVKILSVDNANAVSDNVDAVCDKIRLAKLQLKNN
jgi:hypothetical protein